MSRDFIAQIERHLKGPKANAQLHARYIGAKAHEKRKGDEQSRLTFWGHSVPTQREVARKVSANAAPDELWQRWLDVWNSTDVYDIKSIALIWLFARKQKALRIKKWNDLVTMLPQIDNWAHSDGLSSVLAEILETRPALFTQYKKWNDSTNPWIRRQSLVGIYCYARLRKKPIPAAKSLPLVRNLLEDSHFYVQRGVGWTLREIDRVNSKEQRAFVRQHLNKISATAWFATSELYPAKMRQKLVLDRRKKPV